MSAKNQFDWIAFYEEFADKLLAYKDNRQELIEKIKQVYEVTGIKLPTLERNENGDNEIVDIDPFTTFGLFNKGITNANRVKIITAIKDLFEVSSPVPTYFDGIPVLNNQMATFYWFGNGRGEHDIDNLWDVFDYAIVPFPEGRKVEFVNGLILDSSQQIFEFGFSQQMVYHKQRQLA